MTLPVGGASPATDAYPNGPGPLSRLLATSADGSRPEQRPGTLCHAVGDRRAPLPPLSVADCRFRPPGCYSPGVRLAICGPWVGKAAAVLRAASAASGASFSRVSVWRVACAKAIGTDSLEARAAHSWRGIGRLPRPEEGGPCLTTGRCWTPSGVASPNACADDLRGRGVATVHVREHGERCGPERRPLAGAPLVPARNRPRAPLQLQN